LAKGSEIPQDNWGIAEIVHAIVILSTFHSLSSYALGCGIVPEYDSIEGNRSLSFYEEPRSPFEGNHDQLFGEEPGSSVDIMNPENISPDVASGIGIRFQEPSRESDTEKTEETTVESAKPITIQNKSSTLKRPEYVETIRQTNKLIERLKKHELLQISTEDLSLSSDSSSKVDFENVEEESEY
jgi:hypothetical protein